MGDVLLPVAEAEFGFDISRPHEALRERAGPAGPSQEELHAANRRVCGIAGALSWHAPQNGISDLQRSSFRFFTGGRSRIGDIDSSGRVVKDRPSLPARQWACANQNFPSFSRGSRCDPRARKTKRSRRQRGRAFVPAIRSPSACALVVKSRQCPIRIGLRPCRRNTARKKWLLVYGRAGSGIPKHGQRTLHQRQNQARQPSR